MFFPSNTTEHAPIVIPTHFLWVGLLAMLILFMIISTVLVYHWVTYGYKAATTSIAGIVYFSGSVLFVGITMIAIISYGISL
ncbi:MAG: hypothetical protein COZ49_00695 [Candidatus Yonathbacteria bacterium CG_4_10_14_3_um_filter_47_65]|uniref:Uncharacterized protein n=2 Tax=Parcubacteria group TaxID=1794811 RepID=A0A2M8D6H7_9BACT|nr:MAG: hypothetical protein AUJ44_03925 [Candidatus Nomurabacteria bacterium CG1_02_47_685]PIP04028.1 MAG: hypothetical protein COX54_01145 [Candidatus Yonathbacteria bacterium CG23_combo_of_CG06-09_8_20_14_all_46_18]PIQ32213.1 MAG: hypothetical protein COW61_02025 [Candidatus Yonathbacteria bacterium CG17_big_fil_post_rev_8_21_14_2_50_46_19]PIX56676.1 MAG: hypothetical protein COZ49_00695 [Candidatus Yonathbacteria bacterium CG_4_10_14_3_um_filter_47_65]PIY57869.1 MAG: hypothetical protein CO